MNEIESLQAQTKSVQTTESARAIEEVRGQVLMAKQFPRNISVVMANILEACKRKSLAEVSSYSYPRGGKVVGGPSIKLIQEIARQYGNLDYGVKEIDQREGESVVQSYCWDLETNVRQTKTFTVKHERHVNEDGGKSKRVVNLVDPRDIYEMSANLGARRLRACIEGVIPGWVVEEAEEACKKTLRLEVEQTPIADMVAKLLSYFKAFGVTKELLEKKLDHSLDAVTPDEIIELRSIANALKDKQAKVTDYFDFKEFKKEQATQRSNDINDRLNKSMSEPQDLPQ